MGEKRNPRWTRDELILCLDLYRRSGPNASIERRRELAKKLNTIRQASGLGSDDLRHEGSVESKLGNFKYLDPDREGGLSHGSSEDPRIWDQFWHDPEGLARTADLIQANAGNARTLALEQIGFEVFERPEGRIMTITHQVAERDRALVRAKKKAVLKQLGRLSCEACKFEFSDRYGERGEGFIEFHHTIPIKDMEEGHKTKLSELTLLCANCHRMIHRETPWLTLDQLRAVIRVATT